MKLYILLLGTSCLFAQDLPDPRLTPGSVIPGVTVAQVCVQGYSRTVRNVSVDEKREVYRRYGIEYVKGTREMDHLIPLCIGGDNSVENLWPEPFAGEWGAYRKDALESKLLRMVCTGELSLEQAQRLIAKDWIVAYQIVFDGRSRRAER